MLTYSSVISELESRPVMPERTPSLVPVLEGLKKLHLLPKISPLRVVVVAGTNGKGSVCATLEALLLASNRTVGLYTSPHLIDTTERIRCNGKDISREIFVEAYTAVLQGTDGLTLTHFEMLTLMAAWTFYSEVYFPVPDWTVFEVGMGGKWDACNALPHHWSVLTWLDFDHQRWLGSTLSEIALQKFGIVTKQGTVIHAPLPEAVASVQREVQEKTDSIWVEASLLSYRIEKSQTPRVWLQLDSEEVPLKLLGPRAAENTSLALATFQRLELQHSTANLVAGLRQVHWRGRMEQVSLPGIPCPVYVSGDHNPHGMKSLVRLLADFVYENIYLIVGVGQDKAVNEMLQVLRECPRHHLLLTESPFQGRPLDSYGEWLSESEDSDADVFSLLKRTAKKVNARDLIVVTGSLYLVGKVLSGINEQNQTK